MIPQGSAILATPSAKKVLAENLRQRAHKEEKVVAEAKQLAEKAKEVSIEITAKAGAGDKLFGSITTADLSAKLAKNDVEIDKKYISIFGGNIKRLGQYTAKLRFHREVIIEITFDVVGEA